MKQLIDDPLKNQSNKRRNKMNLSINPSNKKINLVSKLEILYIILSSFLILFYFKDKNITITLSLVTWIITNTIAIIILYLSAKSNLEKKFIIFGFLNAFISIIPGAYLYINKSFNFEMDLTYISGTVLCMLYACIHLS